MTPSQSFVTGAMIDEDPYGRYHKMPIQFNEYKNRRRRKKRSNVEINRIWEERNWHYNHFVQGH